MQVSNSYKINSRRRFFCIAGMFLATILVPLAAEQQQPDGDWAPAEGHAVHAWIGLGANLGDRGLAMQQALAQLAATPGVAVERVSSLYASKPVDSDGPDYLNAWPSSWAAALPCIAPGIAAAGAGGRP